MVMINLLKKLLRDMWKSKGQFIGIAIIIFLGSFFFAGFSSSGSLFVNYIDKYCGDYNLADIWSYYSCINDDQIDNIRAIDGVKSAHGRLTYECQQNIDDTQATVRFHSMTEDIKINNPYVVEGKLPDSSYEVVIDQEYAKAHNIQLQQELAFYLDSEEIDLVVVGFIENVEYIEKISDESTVVPDHNKFGIGYFCEDTVKEIMKGNTPYNEVIISVYNHDDADSIGKQVEEVTNDNTYLYHITRYSNIGYSAFNDEIDQIKKISSIFPIVFFGTAAAMVFITMRRLIDFQRTQIGIMKALGVKRRKIFIHYLEYSIVVGFISSVIGSVLGAIFVPGLLISSLQTTYSLPGIGAEIYLQNILPSVIFAVLSGVIASYLSCRSTLKESSSSAMRPKQQKVYNKAFASRRSKRNLKTSYINIIALRTIFAAKIRTLLVSIGIIGSISILITAIGIRSSVDKCIDTQYTDIYRYQMEVNYNYNIVKEGNPEITDVKSLPCPENVKTKLISETPFEFNNDDIKSHGKIVTIEENSEFLGIVDSKGADIQIPDEGIIISQKLSSKHKISVGDTINIKTTSPIYEGVIVQAEVKGISDQLVTQDIYCKPGYIEKQGLKPVPLKLLVNPQQGTSIDTVKDFYQSQPEVRNTLTISDLRQTMVDYCETINVVVFIMIIGALLLSFAVIYSISSINIYERNRTLATMKVLGFSSKKIYRSIFLENFITTILAVIIGLPIGFLLLKYVLMISSTDTFSFPLIVTPATVILPILLSCVFTFLSNLTLKSKINKIDMVQSLKAVE